MGPKTRHESGSSLTDLVGPGAPMLMTELPTLRDVLRHGIYLQEKCLLEEDVDRRNFPVAKMAEELGEEVMARWSRANAQFCPPVTITNKSLHRKIQV